MKGKDVLASGTFMLKVLLVKVCGDLVGARARAAKDSLAFSVDGAGAEACRERHLFEWWWNAGLHTAECTTTSGANSGVCGMASLDGTDCFKRKMTKSTACILDAGFPMERFCHRLCSIIDSAGSIVTQMRCIGSKFPVIHYGYRVSYI
jgi:hypothetical protein